MEEEDGKIEAKFPIFSDLLAFVWYKMRVTQCITLLGVVEKPSIRQLMLLSQETLCFVRFLIPRKEESNIEKLTQSYVGYMI